VVEAGKLPLKAYHFPLQGGDGLPGLGEVALLPETLDQCCRSLSGPGSQSAQRTLELACTTLDNLGSRRERALRISASTLHFPPERH